MTYRNASAHHPARRVRLVACAMALALSLPQLARADRVTPPPVPEDLVVEAGHKAFLVGHALGTQNYICLPSGSGFAWALFTPEATLFSDDARQVTTHFFAPNAVEDGAIRATWQHSRDTSVVQAKLFAQSQDADFVARGAIAWLLLEVVEGAQVGPTGGDTLTATTYIHRVNTAGGAAPASGCSTSTDVGAKAFVPYAADYFFYSRSDD